MKPNIDYHVDVFGHLYSVSYALRGEVLTAQATATTVELFQRGVRVASHARSLKPGHSTETSHMPSAHRAHAEWTPSRFIQWASEVGRSAQMRTT